MSDSRQSGDEPWLQTMSEPRQSGDEPWLQTMSEPRQSGDEPWLQTMSEPADLGSIASSSNQNQVDTTRFYSSSTAVPEIPMKDNMFPSHGEATLALSDIIMTFDKIDKETIGRSRFLRKRCCDQSTCEVDGTVKWIDTAEASINDITHYFSAANDNGIDVRDAGNNWEEKKQKFHAELSSQMRSTVPYFFPCYPDESLRTIHLDLVKVDEAVLTADQHSSMSHHTYYGDLIRCCSCECLPLHSPVSIRRDHIAVRYAFSTPTNYVVISYIDDVVALPRLMRAALKKLLEKIEAEFKSTTTSATSETVTVTHSSKESCEDGVGKRKSDIETGKDFSSYLPDIMSSPVEQHLAYSGTIFSGLGSVILHESFNGEYRDLTLIFKPRQVIKDESVIWRNLLNYMDPLITSFTLAGLTQVPNRLGRYRLLEAITGDQVVQWRKKLGYPTDCDEANVFLQPAGFMISNIPNAYRFQSRESLVAIMLWMKQEMKVIWINHRSKFPNRLLAVREYGGETAWLSQFLCSITDGKGNAMVGSSQIVENDGAFQEIGRRIAEANGLSEILTYGGLDEQLEIRERFADEYMYLLAIQDRENDQDKEDGDRPCSRNPWDKREHFLASKGFGPDTAPSEKDKEEYLRRHGDRFKPHREKWHYDIMVLSPHRSGIFKMLPYIRALRRYGLIIFYISDDPLTFWPDVSALKSSGYEMKSHHIINSDPFFVDTIYLALLEATVMEDDQCSIMTGLDFLVSTEFYHEQETYSWLCDCAAAALPMVWSGITDRCPYCCRYRQSSDFKRVRAFFQDAEVLKAFFRQNPNVLDNWLAFSYSFYLSKKSRNLMFNPDPLHSPLRAVQTFLNKLVPSKFGRNGIHDDEAPRLVETEGLNNRNFQDIWYNPSKDPLLGWRDDITAPTGLLRREETSFFDEPEAAWQNYSGCDLAPG